MCGYAHILPAIAFSECDVLHRLPTCPAVTQYTLFCLGHANQLDVLVRSWLSTVASLDISYTIVAAQLPASCLVFLNERTCHSGCGLIPHSLLGKVDHPLTISIILLWLFYCSYLILQMYGGARGWKGLMFALISALAFFCPATATTCKIPCLVQSPAVNGLLMLSQVIVCRYY